MSGFDLRRSRFVPIRYDPEACFGRSPMVKTWFVVVIRTVHLLCCPNVVAFVRLMICFVVLLEWADVLLLMRLID
jgi:uncharacterized protein YhhL (DUF1145 family)